MAEEGAWACEDAGQCLADQLRARLAEVEAERDSARRTAETYLDKLAELDRALTAVDDVLLNVPAPSWLDEIAARGEDDRGSNR